jgi:hypothetical protein
MNRKKIDLLVTSVMCELGSSAVTDDKLEAALAERMHTETHKLTTRLNQVKTHVFLQENVPEEVDELLPFVQQETHHDRTQYIIRMLSMLMLLYSTQQPATTEPPSMPTPPPRPHSHARGNNERLAYKTRANRGQYGGVIGSASQQGSELNEDRVRQGVMLFIVIPTFLLGACHGVSLAFSLAYNTDYITTFRK